MIIYCVCGLIVCAYCYKQNYIEDAIQLFALDEVLIWFLIFCFLLWPVAVVGIMLDFVRGNK